MISLIKCAKRFFVREDGPTAVEYALLMALIGIISATSIQSIAKSSNSQFGKVSTTLGS